MEMGKELQINGTVKVTEYIKNNVLIDVAVEGISEKLTLDIDVINSCGCEAHVEEKSDFCHGERRFCGECSCSSRRYSICSNLQSASFCETNAFDGVVFQQLSLSLFILLALKGAPIYDNDRKN